jgi:hypothetical protein
VYLVDNTFFNVYFFFLIVCLNFRTAKLSSIVSSLNNEITHQMDLLWVTFQYAQNL